MYKKTLFVVLLLIVVAAAWLASSEMDLNPDTNSTTINLRYRAEKEYQPDRAEIVLGVELRDTDMEEAVEETNIRVENIVEALKANENLIVETLDYRVNPVEDREEETTYYHVLNQLRVKTDNLDELGLIIQEAMDNGANVVRNINYSLEKREELKQEVITEGIKGIKQKMEKVAADMEMEIENINSLNIDDQYFSDNFSTMTREMAGTGKTAPSIEVPVIKIMVNLQASFTAR